MWALIPLAFHIGIWGWAVVLMRRDPDLHGPSYDLLPAFIAPLLVWGGFT